MHATTGERALWRAVICNAFDDAAGAVIGIARTVARAGAPDKRITNPAYTAAIDQARAWFEGNGADYREVCALAEVDPEAVRDLALRHIAAADAGELEGQRPLTTVLANGACGSGPGLESAAGRIRDGGGDGAQDSGEASTFLDDYRVLYAPERDDEAA